MSARSPRSLALAIVLALGASSAFAAGAAGGPGGASGNSPGGGVHNVAVVVGQQDTCNGRVCPPPQQKPPHKSPCYGGTHQAPSNSDERDCRRERGY